jgi:hypothetical protein
MVTLTVPIATTPPLEGTLVSLSILTVPLQTVTPQPCTRLLPEQQQAYQEEQQSQAHTWQVDAEPRAAQR